MASPEDREHAERLIAAHKTRLHALEIRAAQEGNGIDPAVTSEIADIKVAIAELEAHEPPSEIVLQARRVVRQQYDSELDFQEADADARNRRQIATAIELHGVKDDVLAMKEDLLVLQYHVNENALFARVWAARNFWLIVLTIVIVVALAWALLTHMQLI